MNGGRWGGGGGGEILRGGGGLVKVVGLREREGAEDVVRGAVFGGF